MGKGGTLKRALVLILLLSACEPTFMSGEQAADICEKQARAAQGPTGSVTIGMNSQSGPSLEGAIGVNSNFLQGRDPMQVYDSCVFQRTGQDPIRPPDLRR